MREESIQKIHDVLSGDDLCVGMSTEDEKRPIILRSSGGNIAVSVEVGDALTEALTKEWGEGDVVVRGLKALLRLVRSAPASPDPLPSTKGLAAASLPTIADPVKEGDNAS